MERADCDQQTWDISQGATLAACNRFGLNQQTDVFALGQNGSWNVSWVVGAGTWNGPVAFS
jgi:hypothetical protein